MHIYGQESHKQGQNHEPRTFNSPKASMHLLVHFLNMQRGGYSRHAPTRAARLASAWHKGLNRAGVCTARWSGLAVSLPNAAHAACCLCFGLGIVAGGAQPLHVAGIVGAALSKGLDVVALGGQRHAAQALAHGAQRLTGEQLGAHRLQPAPGDALGGCGWFCPCGLGMLCTTA